MHRHSLFGGPPGNRTPISALQEQRLPTGPAAQTFLYRVAEGEGLEPSTPVTVAHGFQPRSSSGRIPSVSNKVEERTGVEPASSQESPVFKAGPVASRVASPNDLVDMSRPARAQLGRVPPRGVRGGWAHPRALAARSSSALVHTSSIAVDGALGRGAPQP